MTSGDGPPDPPIWVVATGNPGKRREIAEILSERTVELRSLADYPGMEFPDEGTDYAANAIAKARAVAMHSGEIAVGDDSGLEVDALGGGPGPLSARYGGEGLDDEGRVAKLLGALAHVGAGERGARFVCCAALASPAGLVISTRGECRGQMLEAPRGARGFGYDPVFQVEGRSQSMAEIDPAEKNRISHRARALVELWEQWSKSQ